MHKSKIHLQYHAKEEVYSLQLTDVPKNVFSIDTIDKDTHTMFRKGSWIIVLFAGYSGPDIIMVNTLFAIANEFPYINFAFKPYMVDAKIQEFTEIPVSKKATPVLLYRKKNKTIFLSSGILQKEEIKEYLQTQLFPSQTNPFVWLWKKIKKK